MKRPPCYKCEKRSANCHAWCEGYKAWAAENQKRLEAIALEHTRSAVGYARRLAKLTMMMKRKQKGLVTSL